MPHSGGGGSHGGGSHGGSGGSGSSSRTSPYYFPGARRFRRHYYDGRPDDYFYSDATPRKTGISSLIFIVLFGVFFCGMMGVMNTQNSAKKLKENYTRPQTRIIDNIDVIDNDVSLEAALEEYNDTTGICPVIYTMYESEASGYSSLEKFAYDKYLQLFSDERHYLMVYTIPEEQAEDYKSGELKVPDFNWEIMIGDDTDALYREVLFTSGFHNQLEAGTPPGVAFENTIEELNAYDQQLIKSRTQFSLSKLLPFLIVGLFFLIPIISMIIKIKKERDFDYEEVPLEPTDVPAGGAYGVSGLAGTTSAKGASIITLVFLTPFILAGIGITIGAIVFIVKGNTSFGLPMMMFAAMWDLFIGFAIYGIFKGVKESSQNQSRNLNQYQYRNQSQNQYQSHDASCKADHSDDNIWRYSRSDDDDWNDNDNWNSRRYDDDDERAARRYEEEDEERYHRRSSYDDE